MNTLRILPVLLSLSLCAAASVKPPPATVGGQVLDTQGRPLPGALIWIQPAVTTGLVTVRTDARGTYQSPRLVNVPYNAVAYYQTEYRGQSYCLRLASEKVSGYDTFSPDPKAGTVRNFRMQLSGKIPDPSGYTAYFGSEVRLMWTGDYDAGKTVANGSKVTLTFTPDGPLIDGSRGRPFSVTGNHANPIIPDVPVGHYRVSATEVHADGRKTPLIVGQDENRLSASAAFAFQPSGMCGGATSNVGRAFLYVARP